MIKPDKILLSLLIKSDSDVVLARRRGRQVAALLGFDSQNQTRISTAVSEIARNAMVHAKDGRLDFSVSDQTQPYLFRISLSDKGPGIEDIGAVLSGRDGHIGLKGAKQLVDNCMVTNNTEGGLTVRLEKALAPKPKPFSPIEIDQLASSLTKLVSSSPLDEVHQQNQELLEALDDLSTKQNQLDQLNLELAEKNRSLSTLNEEMKLLNESLEERVQARTAELSNLNEDLQVARDEAVLANKLKSQFVANISHEIRTPMSGILGATELVLDSETLDEESRSLIKMAHQSGKNLMSIINDLLDFSKLEAGKSVVVESEFYLASVVDEVIEVISPTARVKEIPITERISSSLRDRLLIGDATLLRQVCLNLLHNAVKFTEHGNIEFACDIEQERDDSIDLKCTITDTGIGIPENSKDRLFHPFVQVDGSNTRRYGGTGLGLSLSKGYILLMGGKIGYKSNSNVGSEFWFVVPLKLGKVNKA